MSGAPGGVVHSSSSRLGSASRHRTLAWKSGAHRVRCLASEWACAEPLRADRPFRQGSDRPPLRVRLRGERCTRHTRFGRRRPQAACTGAAAPPDGSGFVCSAVSVSRFARTGASGCDDSGQEFCSFRIATRATRETLPPDAGSGCSGHAIHCWPSYPAMGWRASELRHPLGCV